MSAGVSTAVWNSHRSSQGSVSICTIDLGCSFKFFPSCLLQGCQYNPMFSGSVRILTVVLVGGHQTQKYSLALSESKKGNAKARSPGCVSCSLLLIYVMPNAFQTSFSFLFGVRYSGISCLHTKFYRTVQKTKQSRDGKATQPLWRTLWLTHTASIKTKVWTTQFKDLMVFSKSKWGKAWTLWLGYIKKASKKEKRDKKKKNPILWISIF